MNLKTNLLPYQEEGFNKMKHLTVGALFMEMGTGKTRTTLELIKYRFDNGKIDKVVWFSPVSIKKNLEQDIKKHSDFTIYSIDGKTTENMNIDKNIIICGIQSTSSSDRILAILDKVITEKTMLVVDESTYIKNPLAKRSKWIIYFSEKVKYKLLLNGTPTTNSVSDLYQQFKFLSPKILGYNSFYSFAQNHLEYDKEFPNKIIKSHNIDYLTTKISPYVFQVRKIDVLNLPPKIRKYQGGYLTDEQKTWYDKYKEEFIADIEMRGYIREGDIYKLFTRLQQVSSGFLQNKKGEIKRLDHNKDLLLKQALKKCSESKIIIFHKYKAELEDILSVIKEDYTFITSNMSEKIRNEKIEDFKKNKKYLIMNLGIGSFGYNLVEAKNIIYYSNKFNFAERTQSEDRIHRIGQDVPVNYIDIYTSNFEEKILNSLEKKENLLALITSELKDKNYNVIKNL